MKLVVKLILAFLLIGLLPFGLISWISLQSSTQVLQRQAFEHLKTVRALKKAQIEDYFYILHEQLDILARSEVLLAALPQFNQIEFPAHQPNDAYLKLAAKYDPHFDNFQKSFGWYDIFMINAQGRIIYTLKRESDLGERLTEATLKHTGISELYEELSLNPESEAKMSDYMPYAPSKGDPAGFFMVPIHFHEGGKNTHYFVALQIPLDKINHIMSERSGLGATGETFLLGKDLLVRSDTFLDPLHHSVKASFQTPNLSEIRTLSAMAVTSGQSGEILQKMDYRGVPTLTAFEPVKLGNLQWGLIAKIDQEEAFAPAEDLQNKILTVTAFLAALILFLALFVTRGISRPLSQLVVWVHDLQDGKLRNQLVANKEDELGELATAMNHLVDLQREAGEAAAKHEWLRDGIANLSQAMVGQQDFGDLAHLVMTHLAGQTSSGLGALYVLENQELHLAGSFAGQGQAALPLTMSLGEGLTGEVAKTKMPLLWDKLPQATPHIRSALAQFVPAALYGFPLIHEDQLFGVVELGKAQAFAPAELDFIQEAAKVITSNLHAAKQQNRIAELLLVTQAANEKLQIQSEELNQTNSQLVAQQQQLEEANQQMEEQQQMLIESKQELRKQFEDLKTAQQTLDQKARELEAANRYKSEFMANMSHELRSPLNAIILLSHQLSKNKLGSFNPDQVKQFHIIEDSGNELLRLINDILDLSKVEAGKMDLIPEAIDSKEFLNSYQPLYALQAEQKGLTFEVQDEFKGEFINDRARLTQILRNLLSNAFKFTRQGKVKLASHRETGYLPLVLVVEDTGIGIPVNKRDLIFEAFRQADGSTSREYGGTGLGLTISRDLVHLMGGQIEVASHEDQGSRFVIRLPLKIAGEPLHRPPLPPPEPPAAREEASATPIWQLPGEILLIEDDPIFAQFLVEQLNQRGVGCLHCPKGLEALALLNKRRFLGVILDLGLPDINGIDLLRELRGKDTTKEIPVFIVTASEQTTETNKLDSIGFLTKPLRDKDLESMLQAFSRQKQLRKQLLMVEDNELQAQAVISLADELELNCLWAKTLDEATKTLEQQWVDLVLLDLRLEGHEGTELFAVLERLGKEIPVIVYTGKELSEAEEDQIQQHAKSIVIKTAYSRERLVDELKWALADQARTTPRPKAQPGMSLKGKRILIVDDDIKNIFVITSVLNDSEAETLHAKNGQEALNLLRKDGNIDLVLMDVMMPVMDGYQAMREIRQDPRLARLPVIAVTAKAMKDDRKKCLEAGADDYLSKPLDADIMIGMIKAWLNKSKEG